MLDDASCCPRPRRHDERSRRQHLAAAFAQMDLLVRVQTGHVGAGRTHAEKERLPPLLETPMLDADRERALLDLVQSGCLKQLREVALMGTREVRLIDHMGLELARRFPEEAQWPPPRGPKRMPL